MRLNFVTFSKFLKQKIVDNANVATLALIYPDPLKEEQTLLCE